MFLLLVVISSILIFIFDILPIIKPNKKNNKLIFILILMLIISNMLTFIIDFNVFKVYSIANILDNISNFILPKSLINFLQN